MLSHIKSFQLKKPPVFISYTSLIRDILPTAAKANGIDTLAINPVKISDIRMCNRPSMPIET